MSRSVTDAKKRGDVQVGRVSNRFRNPEMRRHYAGCVSAFRQAHKDIGTPDNRRRGNGMAMYFWSGWDGAKTGLYNFTERDARDRLCYAYYRAGQDMRKENQ